MNTQLSVDNVQFIHVGYFAGCVFGERKCGGARDTQRVFSTDGGRDRLVCIIPAEDSVTV